MASDAQENDSSAKSIGKIIPKLRGYVIDNECSMARDQFATERNFLSWIKLSLTLATSASIIHHDFSHHKSTSKLAATMAAISKYYFVILAMAILLLSIAYIWEVQFSLSSFKRPLRLMRLLFLEVLGSLAAVSFIFVLAVEYSRSK